MNFAEQFLKFTTAAIAEGVGMLSHMRALMVLSRNPDGLAMQSICDLIGVSSAAMTSIIDALESPGLVKRTPSPYDRRSIVVIITPKGDEFLRRVLP